MSAIQKNILEKLYIEEKLSVARIAKRLKYSENKINYWLNKYSVQKRSVSEAIYLMHNPKGDPFKRKEPETIREVELKGLGLGLYWGEGTKSDKHAIRIGNTDPYLIKKFMEFLTKLFGVNKKDFRFGLQIFSDMKSKEALRFWTNHLKVRGNQFYKVTITPARSLGTYRKKTKHGVLTIYYNNKKLRDVIGHELEKLAEK